MAKRYNIRDNFEDVYLRSKTIQKYLQSADQSLLKNNDFKRTINYISKYFYRRHRGTYQMAGFDLEDIHSIATMFGLVFSGYGQRYETPKDFYTVMMRFISQRMHRMAGWVIKKFQINELAPRQLIHSDPLAINGTNHDFGDQTYNLHNGIVIEGVHMTSPISLPADEDIRSLTAVVDLLEMEYDNQSKICENSSAPESKKARTAKGEIRNKLREAESRLSETKRIRRICRKEQKESYKVLKKELHANWHLYVDQLAYCSVSKYVSSGVRKSARSVCRKYGIDYTGWAKQQIQDHKLTESEITIF